MKILAINGSPKAKNSCTNKILIQLVQGMENAGASTDIVYLANKEIQHCTGCLACWFKTPGVCVINDDMLTILKQISEADLLIYGTPLYCYTTTGLMKDLMDRSLPLDTHPCMSNLEKHPYKYKENAKVLLVSPCGLPRLESFQPLVESFKLTFGEAYLDAILRPTAEAMRNKHYSKQYEEYCDNLAKAGNELVIDGKMSTDTKKKLAKLWISPEEYQAQCKEVFAEKD